MTVYVFTDQITQVPPGCIPIFQKHLYWPGASIRRYSIFQNAKPIIGGNDYLYYMDVDSLVMGDVGDEVLGARVGVQHSENYKLEPSNQPYERNPNSKAAVLGGGETYYCGGFNGGGTEEFFKMCKTLAANIDTDLKNGIVARCYDESHLNRYFIDNKPTVTLTPAYGFSGAMPSLPFEKKIFFLVKDHVEVRGRNCDSAIEKIPERDEPYFITYSDQPFRKMQAWGCGNAAAVGFHRIINYTREWLIGTKFFEDNSEILNMSRGGGYWLWKPFIILETMKQMQDGEVVFYCDSADQVKLGAKEYVFSKTTKHGCFLVQNTWVNRQFTKMDAFVLCDADWEKYHNGLQLEAGICAFVKNEKNIKFLEEWLFYCQNKNILTDLPNVCGKSNFKEFTDHRHDQAVLTLMAIKNDMPTTPISEAFQFIAWDMGKTQGGLAEQLKHQVPQLVITQAEVKRELLKKYRLPEDFGPRHKWWKQPSFQYKYQKMLEENP